MLEADPAPPVAAAAVAPPAEEEEEEEEAEEVEKKGKERASIDPPALPASPSDARLTRGADADVGVGAEVGDDAFADARNAAVGRRREKKTDIVRK